MILPILSSWVFALVVVFMVVKKIARELHKQNIASRHACLQPPKEFNKDPIFGLDRIRKSINASREHRFLPYFHQRYLQNGYTFQTFVLRRKVIHTTDPKNLLAILGTDAKDFSIGNRRISALRPLLGHGIFATDGKQWEKSRAQLRPSFVRDQIADLAIFERHVCHLLDRIPRDRATVDLQELFFLMTMDSATEFLFGKSVGTLVGNHSTTATQFSKDYHEAQDGVITRGRLGVWIHLYPRFKRNFNRAVAGSRAYVRQIAQQAILAQKSQTNSEKLPNCFLTQLAKLTDDENEITDQLLNILLAGRDTTAGLLSIQFHILARRPDVWAKLRAEVSTLRGELPSFERMRDLKYVSWTANETLRLYPIIPRNLRTATKDTVLPMGGGPDGKSPIFVAKGQNITFNIYSLHRRQDIYGSDAEEFKPERWENLRPGWGYLPFGGGPRKCIGQQFALIQAAYTTARIAQHFERIEPRDDRSWQELLTLTCASRYGTKVALIPS